MATRKAQALSDVSKDRMGCSLLPQDKVFAVSLVALSSSRIADALRNPLCLHLKTHTLYYLLSLVPTSLVFCSKSFLLRQCVQGHSTTFSSVRFSVPGYLLQFLNHSELSLVQGDTYGSTCIFLHAVWPTTLVEYALFPVCISNIPLLDVYPKDASLTGTRVEPCSLMI